LDLLEKKRDAPWEPRKSSEQYEKKRDGLLRPKKREGGKTVSGREKRTRLKRRGAEGAEKKCRGKVGRFGGLGDRYVFANSGVRVGEWW